MAVNAVKDRRNTIEIGDYVFTTQLYWNETAYLSFRE